MPSKDPRVDAYIARSADFARPILQHLRRLVHTGCPDVEETFKWSFPHFMHKGILCSMAAFKHHCAFGFWKGELILKAIDGAQSMRKEKDAMGQFGRITSLTDLPEDRLLIEWVKTAVQLNEAGVKTPSRVRSKTPKRLIVPPDLVAALRENRTARTSFDGFSYSHRKEYVEWITEAKRPETRQKRLHTTVQWLAQGKPRNWKYADC